MRLIKLKKGEFFLQMIKTCTNAKNEFGVFEAYPAAHANDIYHDNQIMNIHLDCLAFQVIIWTITCLEIADIHK